MSHPDGAAADRTAAALRRAGSVEASFGFAVVFGFGTRESGSAAADACAVARSIKQIKIYQNTSKYYKY